MPELIAKDSVAYTKAADSRMTCDTCLSMNPDGTCDKGVADYEGDKVHPSDMCVLWEPK